MKLPIPKAALSQHVIVLGKTRSGKSSKMRVLVEHLLKENKPVCIIDPKGDWWGLKSAADGKHAGFPIVIFGGKHADVPLNPKAGAAVAELIATGNRPCLIDLKGWMPSERTRFYIDFISTLFKLHQGERHLVIDEVHNFAPKGKVFSPEAGMMLHWSNTLASEGQGQGLIMLAASQRPQKVHNDLLTSCETLIACRVIHKADRDAIKDWIDGCADPAIGKQVLLELAGMKRAESWCWSPEIGFGPERIEWPLFGTYDSFKPQQPNTAKLKGWAEVDLEEVRAKLQTVVAEAEANDPKMLRKHIADLEHQLRSGKQTTAVPKEDLQRAESRGFERGQLEAEGGSAAQLKAASAAVARLRGAIEALMKFVIQINATGFAKDAGVDPEALRKAIDSAVTQAMKLVDQKLDAREKSLQALQREGGRLIANIQKLLGSEKELTVAVDVKHNEPFTVSAPPARPIPAAPRPASSNGAGGSLSKAERLILTALAQYPEGRTKVQIALLSGYAHNGGGFNNAVSALRTRGLLGGDAGRVTITAEGLAELGPYEALPSGQALLEHWLRQLSKAERSILQTLATAHPRALAKDEIATEAGYEPNGGGFNNALSRLRTLELINGRGEMRASEDLFL